MLHGPNRLSKPHNLIKIKPIKNKSSIYEIRPKQMLMDMQVPMRFTIMTKPDIDIRAQQAKS